MNSGTIVLELQVKGQFQKRLHKRFWGPVVLKIHNLVFPIDALLCCVLFPQQIFRLIKFIVSGVKCKLELHQFPFDEQKCFVRLDLWNPAKQVDL